MQIIINVSLLKAYKNFNSLKTAKIPDNSLTLQWKLNSR